MVEVTLTDRNDELLGLLADADLLAGGDEDEFRVAVRGYLGSRGGPAMARSAVEEVDFDAAAWQRMAAEQGWVAMTLPERLGGAGASFGQVAAVLAECGSVLAYPQLLGAAVRAGALLGEVVTPPAWLPDVVEGRTLVAVVGDWFPQFPSAPAVARRTAAGRWVVTVVDPFVIDATSAGLLLVRARCDADGEDGLFAVAVEPSRRSPGAARALDPSRCPAEVRLTAAPAERLQLGVPVEAAWLAATRAAEAGLAIEQVAASRQLLTVALGYLAARRQFGRPLSSFQALRHRGADLLVDIDAATAATRLAAQAVDAVGSDAGLPCSVAAAAASDCFVRAAAEAIQLHGGIGFTWEHDAHLYFRRAHADAALLGDAAWHRAAIAVAVGLAVP